jgi:hypothetical protein
MAKDVDGKLINTTLGGVDWAAKAAAHLEMDDKSLVDQLSMLAAIHGTKPESVKVDQIHYGHNSYGGYVNNGSGTAIDTYQMPPWMDINGVKHQNHAYTYGPHAGKVCTCDECNKFNHDFQSREEQYKLLEKVQYDAQDTFRSYFFRQSNASPSYGSQIDVNVAMRIAIDFAKKQIAEYQAEMVKKVQSIQLEHTARLGRVMDQQNRMAEVRHRRDMEKLKTGESDGRMFRVGDQEETT